MTRWVSQEPPPMAGASYLVAERGESGVHVVRRQWDGAAWFAAADIPGGWLEVESGAVLAWLQVDLGDEDVEIVSEGNEGGMTIFHPVPPIPEELLHG